MNNKIIELKEKILKKYFVLRAKYFLRNKYAFETEVEIIMEEWITKRILEGQKGRRDELTEKRSKIEELKKFQEFLKEI